MGTEPSRHDRVMELFDQACELPVEEQAAWLDRHCDDPAMRREVEAMLRQDSSEDPLLDREGHGAGLADHAAALLDAPTRAFPERIGDFRIVRKVGAGGMGIIYEAEQESPRRRVAIKVLRDEFVDRALLERFRHEAQALGRLQHPGIAQIHAAELTGADEHRRPYFAMEFVDGLPIDRHADAQGLGREERLELVARVCDAVHHAHQKGVIHRDLKPGNILMARDATTTPEATPAPGRTTLRTDRIGQPKVLDFGIARLTDADVRSATLQTKAGEIIGTLAYMSPEQVRGDTDIDIRSDVYALGVLLHKLLVGRHPLGLDDCPLHEAPQRIAQREPEALGRIDPGLRGDVETIVLHALEKDREQRYGSTAALAADLRRHLQDLPIEARPPSGIEQARKFARRNRGLVAGLVVAAIALLVGAALSIAFALRAADDRDTALAAQSAAEAAQANAEAARADAERARALAEDARRDTEAVAEFQGFVLGQLDVRDIGDAIQAALGEELRASPAFEDSAAGRARVAETLETVNPTNLARRALEQGLLAEAVARIDQRFVDQPLVAARLHISFGDAYAALVLNEQCLAEYERAVELRAERLGEDHPLTVRARSRLGQVLVGLGRLDDAEQVLLEVRSDLEAEDPLDVGEHAAVLHRLGFLFAGRQRFDEVAEVARAAAEGWHRIGQVDEECEAWSLLGQALLQQGEFDAALEPVTHALELARSQQEEPTQQVLMLSNNLAFLLRRTGRKEAGARAYEELVPQVERQFGDDDPRTIRTLLNLAIALHQVDRREDARHWVEEAERRASRSLPEGHALAKEARQMRESFGRR